MGNNVFQLMVLFFIGPMAFFGAIFQFKHANSKEKAALVGVEKKLNSLNKKRSIFLIFFAPAWMAFWGYFIYKSLSR